VLFLGTILAVVVYLTVTDADRTERVRAARARDDRATDPDLPPLSREQA
jgi:hypothetical protein